MTTQVEARPVEESPAELTVVPKRPGLRWVVASLIIAVAVLSVRSVFTNERFGWGVVGEYLRDVSIAQGIVVTLKLTVICMVIGVVLGVVLAIMRLSTN